MKSVEGAQAEIKSYQTLLDKGGYWRVLEHANKSRQENPLGIVPWDPTKHPDWYEKGLSVKRPT